MPRMTLTRTLLMLAGLAAGGVAMLAFLSVINGDAGFAFCTATTRLGWLAPLVAGLVIGTVSLSLLSGEAPAIEHNVENWDSGAVCDACGSPVIDQWRMCPNCGQLLGGDSVSTDEARPVAGE